MATNATKTRNKYGKQQNTKITYKHKQKLKKIRITKRGKLTDEYAEYDYTRLHRAYVKDNGEEVWYYEYFRMDGKKAKRVSRERVTSSQVAEIRKREANRKRYENDITFHKGDIPSEKDIFNLVQQMKLSIEEKGAFKEFLMTEVNIRDYSDTNLPVGRKPTQEEIERIKKAYGKKPEQKPFKDDYNIDQLYRNYKASNIYKMLTNAGQEIDEIAADINVDVDDLLNEKNWKHDYVLLNGRVYRFVFDAEYRGDQQLLLSNLTAEEFYAKK